MKLHRVYSRNIYPHKILQLILTLFILICDKTNCYARKQAFPSELIPELTAKELENSVDYGGTLAVFFCK
jgi:hypothetical protein